MAQDGSKGVTKAITVTLSLAVTVSIAADLVLGFSLNDSKQAVNQLESKVAIIENNYNLLQQQIVTLNPTFNFENSAAPATPPVIQEPAPPPAVQESTPVAGQPNVWVDLENNKLVFSGISPTTIEPVKEEPNNEYSQLFNFYDGVEDHYYDVTFDGTTIKGIAAEEEGYAEPRPYELNGQSITVKVKSVAVFWKAPTANN